MSTVSLSSNPLTTLMPWTSANQQPNFNNAFELKSIQNIALNTLNNDLKNNMNTISFQDQNSYNLNARLNQLANNNINPSNNVIKASSNVRLTNDNNKLRNSLFNIFGKQNEGFWLGALNAANPALDTIFGQNKGYDGKYGSTTVAIDQGYDTLSNQMMKVNPLVGGIMKGVGVAGNILNKVGGGTDGMTKLDSVFNSAPMTVLTLGINGFGGKRADTITKNNEIFERAGASYTATNDTVNRALEKSGKKFGLLSGGSRALTNRLIAEAKRQQNIMTDIVDNATNRFSLRNSMSAINGNRYGFQLEGDYNQKYTQRGKHGLKVSPIIARIVVKKYQKGNKVRTIDESITESFIELLDPNSIPEFKEGGQLTIESEIVPILIEDIEEFKEGGEFNYSTTIELVNPEDLIEEEEQIEEFKEGGSINVIPDGALHARKHNMDMEGITKKGIPVIDNEGKQQCEIEKEEIILRLELTEKLEELQKKYSDYEYSKKEKDEIALEAGKLLVQEILYNTQDNTNNLL